MYSADQSSLVSAYGEFLGSWPWDHYATLTLAKARRFAFHGTTFLPRPSKLVKKVRKVNYQCSVNAQSTTFESNHRIPSADWEMCSPVAARVALYI